MMLKVKEFHYPLAGYGGAGIEADINEFFEHTGLAAADIVSLTPMANKGGQIISALLVYQAPDERKRPGRPPRTAYSNAPATLPVSSPQLPVSPPKR